MFFKKKVAWDLKEYCTQYFDNYILETKPVVAGRKITDSYNEIVKEKLLEADGNFRLVDFNSFSSQALLIRLELFSLAWFHRFGEESSIQLELFMKEYLMSNNKEKIWKDLASYNHAVAQSASMGFKTPAAERASMGFVNTMRIELWKKYNEKGLDMTCVSRTLNKIGTDKRWSRLVLTLDNIANTWSANLNYPINSKTRFILISTFKGNYDGSKQSLAEIKIIS